MGPALDSCYETVKISAGVFMHRDISARQIDINYQQGLIGLPQLAPFQCLSIKEPRHIGEGGGGGNRGVNGGGYGEYLLGRQELIQVVYGDL